MILAMLPTYNEAENIKPLMEEILALRSDMEIVVIDDNSPDGTWRIVGEMAAQNPRIHLIHRKNERGRGSASVVGFAFALKCGADFVVEMDADFSHQPRFIPALLKAAEHADLVIGSRLIAGGGETGRSPIRTLITHLANLYIRLMLGIKTKDCTSGYRVFRRAVIEGLKPETLNSKGPAIVQETLWRCRQNRVRIAEVPILFEERRSGKSTFNSKIMFAGLWAVFKLRFQKQDASSGAGGADAVK